MHSDEPDSQPMKDTQSLTDQILDDFEKRLIASGEIEKSVAEQLIQVARGSVKPKSKDIEKLFQPKDALE